MKSIFVLFALVTAAAFGQVPNIPSGSTVVTSAPSLPPAFQKKQKAFIDSQPRFAAHDYAAAETALLTAGQEISGTPQWHVESGFALMQMAFSFRTQSDAVTSSAIAQRALAHLALADKAYGPKADPAEVANEKEMIGSLYEILLGDRKTAKVYYQAAVALSPTTGQATALLADINRSEGEEAKKRNAAQTK